MKRFVLFLAAFILAACTSVPGTSPAQSALNTTASSCKSIDAAIVASDQAVLSGVLKGDNARTALKGLTAAQTGCVAALGAIKSANAAASAASGVSK